MSDSISFFEYFRKLEEAHEVIERNMNRSDYDFLMNSYNDKKSVVIFIDVDYAKATNSNKIRGQLYEAADLFSKRGGCIYALSSKPKSYFDDGHYQAFTDVFCGQDVRNEDKINHVLTNYSWKKKKFDVYVFGGETFCKELEEKAGNHKNAVISVTGTTFLSLYDGHTPAINYTLVEHILFYLATKKYLKNLEDEFE